MTLHDGAVGSFRVSASATTEPGATAASLGVSFSTEESAVIGDISHFCQETKSRTTFSSGLTTESTFHKAANSSGRFAHVFAPPGLVFLVLPEEMFVHLCGIKTPRIFCLLVHRSISRSGVGVRAVINTFLRGQLGMPAVQEETAQDTIAAPWQDAFVAAGFVVLVLCLTMKNVHPWHHRVQNS